MKTPMKTSTIRSITAFTSAASAAMLLAAAASAHHEGDMLLQISGDRIATYEAAEGGPVPRRVFAGVLGEFGIPGVGDEPGFDNEPGTFVPGTVISFTINAALKVWDGTAFATTAADPLGGVRVKLSFDQLSTTSGAGPVDGFGLFVAPNGEWHTHYIFELLPAEGFAEADPGAYLLELVLHTTQQGVASSRPFWIVMNHELDEQSFDEIFELAEASLGCRTDLNGNGSVDGADLAILLGSWGSAGEPGPADLDENGAVNGADLAILLGSWGACD